MEGWRKGGGRRRKDGGEEGYGGVGGEEEGVDWRAVREDGTPSSQPPPTPPPPPSPSSPLPSPMLPNPPLSPHKHTRCLRTGYFPTRCCRESARHGR